MKKLILILFALIVVVSCNNKANTSKRELVTETDTNITQVIYFHGKQRCITCRAIEDLTRHVVDSLGNSKVVMKIVDISQKENEDIAAKYEVTWSSLILDRNNQSDNLTEMAFSYAKGQPDVFKAKLVEAIQKISR